ncbi:cysteine--tRNA ligase [Candidatus Shapirobacteria bacterium]|nr:cysteine--tRNA ligase [Candidatus Shapirobacteria bacterium]
MMQKIYLYNTATRKKEEFKPIKDEEMGIYSCGPTVYSSPHIGNMYAYVCWDVLVRTARYLGYNVKWVVNITDVGHLVNDSNSGEDKMEKGSRITGLTAWDLAKKYEKEFDKNLEKLNITKPEVMPRATDHIKEQIELIQKIEANGFTYKISDGIYFDTDKMPNYGEFANIDIEKLKEGARVEVNEEKKSPTDFALWKFSPKNERRQMEWDSPWGVGFPGWHIECTAMSTKYLGNPFDIHTGGEDHIAIHHTNEIAQGFGAFGAQTANVWMHNAFITFNGAKISKSTGGLYTVFELEKMGCDPLAYRYMVLSSHYRKGMAFSEDNLKAAETGLNKLRNFVAGDVGQVNQEYKKLFEEKIGNDLAMPEVMAVVWKLVKDENVAINDKRATIYDFDRVLGLNLNQKVEVEKVPTEVEELAKKRFEAKSDKNWAEADRLRGEIIQLGYLVEDTAEGYKIKKS